MAALLSALIVSATAALLLPLAAAAASINSCLFMISLGVIVRSKRSALQTYTILERAISISDRLIWKLAWIKDDAPLVESVPHVPQ